MAFDDPSGGFDQAAQILGLNDEEDVENPSNYWAHLDGDDLGQAIVDRFQRFRQFQSSNGLLKGWRLKLSYYHNEYRADPEIPHLAIMQQFGSQGEYQYVPCNALRSILKTVLSSVVQNPPNFKCVSTNADADSLEASALYQGVIDYYARDLGLAKIINKAVEIGLVCDQGFILTEWDAFAVDPQTPADGSGVWNGAPSVKALTPWDVCYDITKSSWKSLDWVIVRDWEDAEKLKAQFPELEDEIDGCRRRAEVVQSNSEYEGNTRFTMQSYTDISNDVQVFKMFYRHQPWMENGRFVMCLETGDLLFDNPTGLIYPRLPVERFVCDDCVDILLGYSPINELLALQESVNTLLSSIQTNSANYANQYVACQIGTDLNPRTLADGQKIIEYPAGSPPPQGLNLTAIPEALFQHLKDLLQYMQEIPSVSNASRGQAPGANSTGSAMLFLAGQTTANQGSMSDNYAQFSANVMTSLLHVLRTFAKTSKTIGIMGKSVASRQVVLSDTLEDFDSVVVDLANPMAATPQGKMQMAQMLLQYGGCTPQQYLQVLQSGTLSAATDPAREMQYYLDLEDEWLMQPSQQVLVNALDNHQEHIMSHTRLLSTPWLRNPQLAQQLGYAQAPQIMQNIMNHIQQHMGFLGANQNNQMMTNAGAQPGEPPGPSSPAMGHQPPMPSPAAPMRAPAQAQAQAAGTHLPSPPSQPQPQPAAPAGQGG